MTHLSEGFYVAKCLFSSPAPRSLLCKYVQDVHDLLLVIFLHVRVGPWEPPAPALPPLSGGCDLKSLTAGRVTTTQETGLEEIGREQWRSADLK